VQKPRRFTLRSRPWSRSTNKRHKDGADPRRQLSKKTTAHKVIKRPCENKKRALPVRARPVKRNRQRNRHPKLSQLAQKNRHPRETSQFPPASRGRGVSEELDEVDIAIFWGRECRKRDEVLLPGRLVCRQQSNTVTIQPRSNTTSKAISLACLKSPTTRRHDDPKHVTGIRTDISTTPDYQDNQDQREAANTEQSRRIRHGPDGRAGSPSCIPRHSSTNNTRLTTQACVDRLTRFFHP